MKMNTKSVQTFRQMLKSQGFNVKITRANDKGNFSVYVTFSDSRFTFRNLRVEGELFVIGDVSGDFSTIDTWKKMISSIGLAFNELLSSNNLKEVVIKRLKYTHIEDAILEEWEGFTKEKSFVGTHLVRDPRGYISLWMETVETLNRRLTDEHHSDPSFRRRKGFIFSGPDNANLYPPDYKIFDYAYAFSFIKREKADDVSLLLDGEGVFLYHEGEKQYILSPSEAVDRLGVLITQAERSQVVRHVLNAPRTFYDRYIKRHPEFTLYAEEIRSALVAEGASYYKIEEWMARNTTDPLLYTSGDVLLLNDTEYKMAQVFTHYVLVWKEKQDEDFLMLYCGKSLEDAFSVLQNRLLKFVERDSHNLYNVFKEKIARSKDSHSWVKIKI